MLGSTLPLCLLLPAALYLHASEALEPQNQGCKALHLAFPDSTLWPGQVVYVYESQNFWSSHQILDPACVFRPANTHQVSKAALVMGSTRTAFAVRGGGRMAIKGANNIDGGPLIVMSNLTNLELSKDKKSHKLAVAGGRLSPVGVPGLLLAGGINFHGNQRGWAADNILEYEVMLSSGKVVSATSESNKDLFWALKRGANNLGIVTKFRLATFRSGQIYAGIYSVADIPGFLKAIAHFSAFNADPLAHIVPQVIAVDEKTTIGGVILYYDSDLNPEPECFRPFFDLPAVSSSFAKKTLAEFSDDTGQLVTPNIMDQFIAGTTTGKTYGELLQAIQIVNDGFLAALPGSYTILPAEDRVLLSVDWQPLGSLWKQGSKKHNPGGNAIGFDPESKGTYLAWAEVVEWRGEHYNDAVFSWIRNTTWAIANATREAGLYDSFNYMGDAAGFQNVFDGYGAENKERLLRASRKYDPQRIFQKLWHGGFKIGP
ncbi:hypothetical protein ACJ41O_012355 [Fusarium nematophilum]